MIRELTEKNRSYRGYDPTYRFTRDELLAYVDCARLCPSSVNKQPLKYYLAWEAQTVAKIQAETRWARALQPTVLPRPGKEPTAFIVICQDAEIDSNLNRYMKDVGIVAQTMLLAAVEEGKGGCMIGNFTADAVRNVLNLPEHLHPLLIVAFGKPAEDIVLVDVPADGNTNYYRDENDVHYVPKRRLKEIVID